MLLKPSIDALLNKIDSKYSLVILASKRAHELDEDATPMLDEFESVKNVGKALEEIEAGFVKSDPNPELKRALKKRREEEKKAAKEKEKQELEERIQKEQKEQKNQKAGE